MRLTSVKIGEIKPYKNNPRINDGAVEAVVESIKQCGYCAPIVVDENMEILAGHTRLKALQRLEYEWVDVVIRDGLTDEQKRKYRVLDNKTNEFAEWDFALLEKEIADLDFGDFDFGFDLGEKDEIVEDDAPEPPTEARAKRGDLYLLGRHRVMCGDATMLADVEKLMGGQKADLFLTDPPYNVDYTGKTKDALKIENDRKSDDDFRDFLETAFSNAKMAMKGGAAFYIWHADSEGYNFRAACEDAGLSVRQCLVWVKNTMVLGRQDYQWKHEPCLYGWNDGAGHAWYSDRKQTTVLNFDRPSRSAEHPTMKPVALFAYQIGNSTKAGDIVLDLFGGSGTTIAACEQNGRSGYVMELDPRYVDVIVERWETLTGKKAVLAND